MFIHEKLSMKKIIIFIISACIFLFPLAETVSAQPMGRGWSEKPPYGDYCPGSGGWYGAKKKVSTPEQARILLEEYFKKTDVRIGRIVERKWFFAAEILDQNNVIMDIVIIDKRTGRIRTTY